MATGQIQPADCFITPIALKTQRTPQLTPSKLLALQLKGHENSTTLEIKVTQLL